MAPLASDRPYRYMSVYRGIERLAMANQGPIKFDMVQFPDFVQMVAIVLLVQLP